MHFLYVFPNRNRIAFHIFMTDPAENFSIVDWGRQLANRGADVQLTTNCFFRHEGSELEIKGRLKNFWRETDLDFYLQIGF